MRVHKRHLKRTEHATTVDAALISRVVIQEVARQLGLDAASANVTYRIGFVDKDGASVVPRAQVVMWLDEPELGR